MGKGYIKPFHDRFISIVGRAGPNHLADKCVHTLDRCKIALLVETDPAGGFTTDTGTWAEIATRGKAVVDLCLWSKQRAYGHTFVGGAGYAGANRKLNIVVYEKDSVFDRAITGDPSGGVVDGNGNGSLVLLNASGWAGNLSRA